MLSAWPKDLDKSPQRCLRLCAAAKDQEAWNQARVLPELSTTRRCSTSRDLAFRAAFWCAAGLHILKRSQDADLPSGEPAPRVPRAIVPQPLPELIARRSRWLPGRRRRGELPIS